MGRFLSSANWVEYSAKYDPPRFVRLGFELVDVGFVPGNRPNPYGEKVFYEPGELLEISSDFAAEEGAVQEGLAYMAEARLILRDPRIIQQAKKRSGYRCEVCDFDFVKTYGNIGEGISRRIISTSYPNETAKIGKPYWKTW